MMYCQEITLPSSRGALFFFVLFSFGLCFDSCDIGNCSSVFQAAFSKLISSDIDSLCRDMKQVSKCVTECQQVFFPHLLDINTTVSLFKEICDEEFVYDVADHWECIRNHLNKFFMCVARYSGIKSSTSGSSDGKLISCRRKLMIFDCPEEIFFNRCEDEAVQIVSKRFKTALKPWLNSSCYGIPQNKVYNLDVNHGLKSDFHATANCMDNYSFLAEDCFSEYLEKAIHSGNYCWKDTTVVCNKPSSSIPCAPLSSVANFYSSLFSYGELDCVEPSTTFITKSETNPETYGSSPDDFGKQETSTQIMQPPSSTMDSTDVIIPETKPPVSINDLKPNDENILPSNHMRGSFVTSTEKINLNFSIFESSLNVTSSEGLDVSSVKYNSGSPFINVKSVSSHSQGCTYTSTLLFLSYIFVILSQIRQITMG